MMVMGALGHGAAGVVIVVYSCHYLLFDVIIVSRMTMSFGFSATKCQMQGRVGGGKRQRAMLMMTL